MSRLFAYEVARDAVIDGTPEQAWQVQADVAGWPAWNSHEQAAGLEGPFAVGVHGWSKPRGGPRAAWVLTEVEEPTRWGSRSTLPGGSLTGRRTFTATPDGRQQCTYRMRATGPCALLFRLWFGTRVGRDMEVGFGELEAEIRRRPRKDEHVAEVPGSAA